MARKKLQGEYQRGDATGLTRIYEEGTPTYGAPTYEEVQQRIAQGYQPPPKVRQRRITKKELKALRPKRPPNQWQMNLTAWNANNSGWCIPKRGTADYDKVKNFHIRRGIEVGTPPTQSRRPGIADFYDMPTPEQLTYVERPSPARPVYARGAVVEEMEKLRREVRAMRESM